MNGPLGIASIAAGTAVAVSLGIAWRRLTLGRALVAMALASALVGAGALLVQDEVEPVEWIVTLAAFAVLGPLQAHLLLSRRG